jgi:PAT family acetyl-CoA transporter-like MFS transporter 1
MNKDFFNIIFLIFLYVLQCVPLGLISSLPYIFTTYKISYSQQASFSFALWPFSLKLLWAPIVDSIYVKSFGRRRSWLIPIQYLIGFYMVYFSSYVEDILEKSKNENNGNKKKLKEY